jgi:hypothetical protein
MKLAKFFWITGALLINVTIGFYIYLQSKAPLDIAERYTHMNDQWALFAGHWKIEFLLMTIILIAALYFAFRLKDVNWTIVSVGQSIILLTYPLMLGGYANTPVEVAEMANQMALTTFVFGNMIFMVGLFCLYMKTQLLRNWIKYVAVTLAAASSILFLLVFIELIAWGEALFVAPMINILYLLNAYYGTKIKVDSLKT